MKESASFPAKLTDRQRQILDLIQSVMKRTGAPPTRAEISSELGFKSANAAEEHLQALARKGAIELVSGTSRGIRLKNDMLQAINAGSGQDGRYSAAIRLPLVGRVAAGLPILAQQHIESIFQMEASLFTDRPDYLLQVRGMSMNGAGILDGDLLAVKTGKDAQNGQIVVARLEDDVTVKRFVRTQHCIELRAENPAFDTIVVTPDDRLEIEGLAVGLIRKNIFS